MASERLYGVLAIGSRRLGMDDGPTIARQIGIGTPTEVTGLLRELARNRVFVVDAAGTIVSIEMLRAAKRRDIARLNGSKGGNPALAKPEPAPAYDGPSLFDAAGMSGIMDHQEDLQQGVVDLSDLDLDPEPDKRGAVASVNADAIVYHADTGSFLRWFAREGIDAGVIGKHFLLMLEDYARQDNGTQYASTLLSTYGRPECEVRAARLFTVCHAKHWRPTMRMLFDRWTSLDGEQRQPAAKQSDTPQGLSTHGKRAMANLRAAAERNEKATA